MYKRQFLVFAKIIKVTTNKTPLTERWENSINSEVSDNAGIIFPLHVGHVAPHPSPDPVALTNAPAKIEAIDNKRPAFA